MSQPTAADTSKAGISLALPRQLRVAGENLAGEVHLDFTQLHEIPLEAVFVKLRGSVFTSITRQQGAENPEFTRRHTVEHLSATLSVWHKGDAYPQPGTHILKLPFTFTLPADLLPSFQYVDSFMPGIVAYSVEAVGVRAGRQSDKKVSQALALVAPHAEGAKSSQQLRSGWTGTFRATECSKNIRRGLWGDQVRVQMVILLPDIDVLPIFSHIPFKIQVTTLSKTMNRDETPTNKPIFPAPPVTPNGIELTLKRSVDVQADSWISFDNRTNVSATGSLDNTVLATGESAAAQQLPIEKTWIPALGDSKKQRGCWKQEVTLNSTFMLTCPPSFSGQSITVKYLLAMKAAFPGIGNDLKGEVPITIVSCMYPPVSGTTAWDEPPPELDLPPAYYSAVGWNHEKEQ